MRLVQCETCKTPMRVPLYTVKRWCSRRCKYIPRLQRMNRGRRLPFPHTTKGKRLYKIVYGKKV